MSYAAFAAVPSTSTRRLLDRTAALIDWHAGLRLQQPAVRQRWFVGGTTNLCHNAVDRHAWPRIPTRSR